MEHQVIHEYKLGKEMKISTIFVAILLLICFSTIFVVLLIPFYAYSPSDVVFWIMLFIAVVSLPLCSIIFIYIPKNITIGGSEIRINMSKKKKIIDINNVARVEAIDKTLLAKSIRTWGMGGFFGNAGDFMNKTLGEYERYTSSNEDLLLITLNNNKKIVVNCDKETLVKYIDDYKNNI